MKASDSQVIVIVPTMNNGHENGIPRSYAHSLPARPPPSSQRAPRLSTALHANKLERKKEAMSSRFVRFASPGSGNGNGNGNNENNDAPAFIPGVQDNFNASFIAAANIENRRNMMRRASSSSSIGFRRASASSNNSDPMAPIPVAMNNNNNNNNSQSQRPSLSGYNTAIAANDGPSLAAALAQSIRHHARMIDGEKSGDPEGVQQVKAAYDPYEDDDHVSLAPGVELNYEKDAYHRPPPKHGSVVAPAMRDYVANAGVQESDNAGGGVIDKTVERQQQRLDQMQDNSFGSRFRTNISNWFGLDTSDKSCDKLDGSRRTVRFEGDNDTQAVAAAIANGEAVPGAATFGTIVGRAPKFIAPPATAFRTATRHPSHLPATEFDNLESRLNAPRRILAARKRHRRNDSCLRMMVAVLCFGLSLTLTILYGEGRFGLAVTNMAYERKIAGRYEDSMRDSDDRGMPPPAGDVFYPDWWEAEKGIPDMEGKNVKFSPTLEYNAADVATERAPDRIETPFFWFVPRSGGNALRTIMSRCLRLAEASEYGADIQARFIRIEEQEDRRFVNVDMSTSKGLQHAKDLKLASSAVPDVVISGDIHGVLNVFNNRNRARIFAVLRHPIDRAISKYYADLASDPEVSAMTLPQYVRSGGHRVENNYLTRYLSGRYGGNLGVNHLNIAREFLRRKFVVGLSSDLPATANLFSHVFGWNNTAANLGLENVDLCYNNIFNALKDKSPQVEEGSEGWKLLVAQNWFDLKLYEYAEHLFELQVDQLKLTGSINGQDDIGRTRE